MANDSEQDGGLSLSRRSLLRGALLGFIGLAVPNLLTIDDAEARGKGRGRGHKKGRGRGHKKGRGRGHKKGRGKGHKKHHGRKKNHGHKVRKVARKKRY
jgi:hypothetical protein